MYRCAGDDWKDAEKDAMKKTNSMVFNTFIWLQVNIAGHFSAGGLHIAALYALIIRQRLVQACLRVIVQHVPAMVAHILTVMFLSTADVQHVQCPQDA